MRPLLISALAATLTGCACFAPPPVQRVAKTENTIAAKKENPRHRGTANTHTKNAKPDILPKMDASSSAQPNDKSNAVIDAKPNISPKMDASSSVQPNDKSNTIVNEKSTVGAKSETPQSSQLDDKSVMEKAKVTIAAKMENPASVEFKAIKRAERKNAAGKSIDSICGYVREKTAPGGETGDRPFLYLVQEDEAYIGGYSIATSPHHNICN